MKELLVVASCALFLSVAAPSANASKDIRFWPHSHKDRAATTEASKPKPKRSLLHHAKHSRDQAARSEATYGMTGPKSVGLRHPQPGPAGYGAN